MTGSHEDTRTEPSTLPSVPSEVVLRRLDGPLSERPPPVFLHSSFRTGSTWLWQKVRSAPTTLAYYEVFHEYLATLTPQQAKAVIPSAWDSRHPPCAPYFLEYLPLIEPKGGIAGLDRSIPLLHVVPRSGVDGDLEPVDTVYVDRLISAAWSRRRIPVLTCTRSLGRARALRRSFGGKTIVLHRNLFHQWTSYCWQAEAGNSFFLDTIRYTIKGAAHDPFLREVSDWFGLDEPDVRQENLFQAFVLLHLYLYAIAFDAADLIVDIEEIAKDREARGHVEHEISKMIRHDVDLSDVCVPPCEFTGLAIADPPVMRDTIEQFAKLIPTAAMSPAAMAFVGDAKDRALTEWERFEFFNRRTRMVLTGKIEAAEARAREQEAITASLQAERDAARAAAAQAQMEASQARTDATETSAQHEALRAGAAAAEAARDALQAALAQAQMEASQARTDATETSAQREALRAEVAAAEAARDELQVALTQAQMDASQARTDATETSVQREALRAEVAAGNAARDELVMALAQAKGAAPLSRLARKLLTRGGS